MKDLLAVDLPKKYQNLKGKLHQNPKKSRREQNLAYFLNRENP